MRVAAACVSFTAAVTWASLSLAEPVRILVAAGHRFGLAAENPLKYADSDATRVREVLVHFGGVRPEHAAVLAEPSRSTLFAAVDRARDIARKHRSEEVTLVFYYSGHGDRDALHLGEERVLISELTAKLGEVPAGLRIAVTDSCRTNRHKGFVPDEAFAIAATTGPEASGQVWLHASREGETAQESDDLGGAIFTHAWLNGLRGAADANGDSRVTLDESFAFAHSQTLIRSAKSSGVLQKPEAIVSLRELAPVVLTQTVANTAKLSFPPARDTHFLVYSAGSKAVLSELWGAPDRRVAFALPPGRYSVQRRAGGSGGAAQITIAAGEERKLEDRDFAVSALAAVAQKGEADAPEPLATKKPARHEIAGAYEVVADTRTGLAQGPAVSYALGLSRVAIGVGGGADFAARSVSDTKEKLTTAYGRAGVELRVPMSSLAVHFGVGVRTGWLWQTLRRDTFPETSQRAFVMGPDAKIVFRAPLGTSFFVDVGATGRLLFLKEEDEIRGIPSFGGVLAIGGML